MLISRVFPVEGELGCVRAVAHPICRILGQIEPFGQKPLTRGNLTFKEEELPVPMSSIWYLPLVHLVVYIHIYSTHGYIDINLL